MQVRTAQPIATRDKPSTDRRAVFVSIENESATLDLLIAQQNDKFGQLRCIYIDTSAQDSSGNGCTIETDIGQKITALANTQGYYPVFVPFVTKLTISSNEAVTLLMLDFDMRPVTWATVLQSGSVPDPLHVIIDNQPIATDATVQNWPAVQPVSISGQPIEVVQINTWSVSVVNATLSVTQAGLWNVGVTGTVACAQSGAWSVAVNNFPATQPVSGTVAVSNFPATQPVSGTVAATQSGAWNVAVNNFPATQPVSGTVAVSNFPATQSIGVNSHAFNTNGSANAWGSSRTNLCNVAVCANGLTCSAAGNVQLFDGAGNLLIQKIIPVCTNFSGVLLSMDNLALPLNNAGVSGTFAVVGATISAGYLEVFAATR